MSAIPTISRCSQRRTLPMNGLKENEPEGVVFGYEIIE
jgi:hypothetical protein